MSLGAPELDAMTADAIVGEVSRASHHALPIGTPCPNCTTPLAGPWCHACGQKGEKYDRSILHLIAEAFEGLTHLDGRVWNTLPKLVYQPGKLTRSYLDGHRATQIPPFRLYLVVLLLVFFSGGLAFSGKGPNPAHINVTRPDAPGLHAAIKANEVLADEDKVDLSEAVSQLDKVQSRPGYWNERAKHAVEKPEAFLHALEQWGHRFAILMLPIAAAMLSVLFLFKKGVYVFDHLIFSMHSLSFQGLLLTVIFLGSLLSPLFWWLLWLMPVHLFVHMKGTYRSHTLTTLVRMFLLFMGTSWAVGFLLLGLLIVGLATTH
jgi:hypothetical protein